MSRRGILSAHDAPRIDAPDQNTHKTAEIVLTVLRERRGHEILERAECAEEQEERGAETKEAPQRLIPSELLARLWSRVILTFVACFCALDIGEERARGGAGLVAHRDKTRCNQPRHSAIPAQQPGVSRSTVIDFSETQRLASRLDELKSPPDLDLLPPRRARHNSQGSEWTS